MTSSYRISKTGGAPAWLMSRSFSLFLLAAFSMIVTAQVITPAPRAFGAVEIDDLFLQRRQQTACDGKAGFCESASFYAVVDVEAGHLLTRK
jgi:hypothetical protein